MCTLVHYCHFFLLPLLVLPICLCRAHLVPPLRSSSWGDSGALKSPRKKWTLRTTFTLVSKWWGRMVLWCSLRGTYHFSKIMKAYCERQGLSRRQIRFQFDRQPVCFIKTHLHSWKWRRNIQLMCLTHR